MHTDHRSRSARAAAPLVLLATVLVACGAGSTGASLRPEGSFDRPTVGPSAPPVTGEAPPGVVAAAMAVVAEATGADMSTATIVEAEAVEWSDGALGCPEPDLMYIQVITPGYRIVIDVGGEEYDVRTNDDGSVARLCDPLRPAGT